MDTPAWLITLFLLLATLASLAVSSQAIDCQKLCLLRQQSLSDCGCPGQDAEDDSLVNLQDLQEILKKAAPHNKIFKWGRKRSIADGATDHAGDASYAPQEVQRRIFRWGKRSAPAQQNQIFRWGKKRTGSDREVGEMGSLLERSPSYGDFSTADVLRLEQAIRQGRLDYYDVLAGPDVPVGKRRNMSPEMQNHIFKWGR